MTKLGAHLVFLHDSEKRDLQDLFPGTKADDKKVEADYRGRVASDVAFFLLQFLTKRGNFRIPHALPK